VERRWRQRFVVRWKATVVYREREIHGCVVRDFSADGMCIEIPDNALRPGSRATVIFGAADGGSASIPVAGLIVHTGASSIGLLVTTEWLREAEVGSAA
jgi:hypothetical protein